ncbi:HD domain-containing protein C4G3.17 [Ananas comosus]|uniref:HD domain-containing protein C4G3.17 n=1 Tax=Ananas comosus TaxID=4615 RepID=A0A199V6M8_ANACO|nr:HD domain-containing protein C4G3.17 [Ananas comosus]
MPSTISLATTIEHLVHSTITTKRKGWINHGIKGPESIADHLYRMALMALIADELPGVNRERCIKIAIVHDIAEVEMILQALEYEMTSALICIIKLNFNSFLVNSSLCSTWEGKFQTDLGKRWAAEVVARRNKRLGKQA